MATLSTNPTLAQKNELSIRIQAIKNQTSGEERLNKLAPLILQQELNIDKPLGLIIDIEILQLAIDNSGDFPWDKLVCTAGLEEGTNNLRPTYRFYSTLTGSWVEVEDVLGGGGGGGVASSTPPPTQ